LAGHLRLALVQLATPPGRVSRPGCKVEITTPSGVLASSIADVPNKVRVTSEEVKLGDETITDNAARTLTFDSPNNSDKWLSIGGQQGNGDRGNVQVRATHTQLLRTVRGGPRVLRSIDPR
jgi:hypothetical protein